MSYEYTDPDKVKCPNCGISVYGSFPDEPSIYDEMLCNRCYEEWEGNNVI